MTTLPLYNLLYNYLQHSWNTTSITSAILSIRDILLPSTFTTTTTPVNKRKHILYPTLLKEKSEAIDFFAMPMNNTHRHVDNGLLSPVTPQFRAPRGPIVLCHGLYGFDRMGPELLPSLQVHYWNGIEKALCDLGAKVIITRVPKADTISNRAYALHSIMSSFMSNQQINFIAHSMGGLDCRYLLSHIKHRSYQVSSLSTVCTPHRGSPVMDWFREKVGIGQYPPSSSYVSTTSSCMMSDFSSGVLRRSEEDESPITSTNTINHETSQQQQQQQIFRLLVQWFDNPAYSNLTTDYCTQHFNPSTPDDPSVSYYSYTAKSTPSQWSSLLDLPGHFIQQVEGDNDGVVSVQSGQWGQHVKTIEDADHWDFTGKSMVPYRWKTVKEFDRADFYVELANYLFEQGH